MLTSVASQITHNALGGGGGAAIALFMTMAGPPNALCVIARYASECVNCMRVG